MVEQRSLSRKIKSVIILLLLCLLMIFTLQNSERVGVAFLFWDTTLPRSLIFFVFFIVGFLVGIAGNNWKKLIDRE